MTRLIRSELIKIFTIRTTYVLIMAGIGMAFLAVAGLPPKGAESPVALQDELLAAASAAYPITLILGALVSGGEFQHKTISQTLLLAPARARLLAAKMTAGALASLAISVPALLTALLAGAHALTQRGTGLHATGHAALTITCSVGADMLWAALGGALGALFRGQSAAIVTALLVIFAIDPAAQALAPRLWRYLPTAADQGLTQRKFSFAAITSLPPLGRAAALATFLAWITAAGAVGAAVLRRDITH
jgi:hypothetical protein